MIKKLFCIFLPILLLVSQNMAVFAEENSSRFSDLPAKSAMLVEESSGKILAEKNADEQMAPASITKIMTLLLIFEALENGNLAYDDMVNVSPNAKILGGSEIWLEVGEQMSVNDMIKAIAVASANDASVAMAEHISGSEEIFVERMNNRAKELGMSGTNFMNSHGLDEDNHYTTARDIITMTTELLKHREVLDYTSIWMDTLRNGETELVNTNKLIRFYSGATGLKTGTTDNAGHSLVATAERNGLSLIAVTLGSETGQIRFDTATALLDYGFANYQSIPVPNAQASLEPVQVLGGTQESVVGVCTPPQLLILPKSEKMNISTRINIAENLLAPVEKGQLIGNVDVMLGEEIACSYDILAGEYVEKMGIADSVLKLFSETVLMK